MKKIDKLNYLPYPIICRYRMMQESISGLKRDYITALSLLIDTFDIYLQLTALIPIVSHIHSPENLENKSTLSDLEYLKTAALSTGHWLSFLKSFSKAFHGDKIHFLFNPKVYDLVYEKNGKPSKWIEIFDKLPEIRNKEKGHGFTKDQEKAKIKFDEILPYVNDLLNLSTFWKETSIICIDDSIEDNEIYTYECFELKGPHPEDSKPIFTSNVKLESSGIYFVNSNVIDKDTYTLSKEDLLSLSPFIITSKISDEANSNKFDILMYQGVKGKNCTYLNPNTASDFKSSEMYHQLQILLHSKVTTPEKNHYKEPAWASKLDSLNFFSHKKYINQQHRSDEFYKGAQITWGGLLNNIDIQRVIWDEETLISFGDIFTQYCLNDETKKLNLAVNFILFGGNGGSGKTTILRRMAINISLNLENAIVLECPLGASISFSDIEITFRETKKNIFIFVDNAERILKHIANIIQKSRELGIPLTIFGAERLNQITDTSNIDKIYHLKNLQDNEIESLITKLEYFNALYKLENLSHIERIQAFKSEAENQILVGLRSATEGKDFDKIIIDEYNNIQNIQAKNLYLWSCLLDCYNIYLPTSIGKKYTQCKTNKEFRINIIQKTQGVMDIHSIKDIGSCLKSRHKLISEIISKNELHIDEEFVEELCLLLTHFADEKIAINSDGFRDYSLKVVYDLFTKE